MIDIVQTDIITIQRIVYSLSFYSKMIIGIIVGLLVIILLLLLSLIKYAVLRSQRIAILPAPTIKRALLTWLIRFVFMTERVNHRE